VDSKDEGVEPRTEPGTERATAETPNPIDAAIARWLKKNATLATFAALATIASGYFGFDAWRKPPAPLPPHVVHVAALPPAPAIPKPKLTAKITCVPFELPPSLILDRSGNKNTDAMREWFNGEAYCATLRDITEQPKRPCDAKLTDDVLGSIDHHLALADSFEIPDEYESLTRMCDIVIKNDGEPAIDKILVNASDATFYSVRKFGASRKRYGPPYYDSFKYENPVEIDEMRTKEKVRVMLWGSWNLTSNIAITHQHGSAEISLEVTETEHQPPPSWSPPSK